MQACTQFAATQPWVYTTRAISRSPFRKTWHVYMHVGALKGRPHTRHSQVYVHVRVRVRCATVYCWLPVNFCMPRIQLQRLPPTDQFQPSSTRPSAGHTVCHPLTTQGMGGFSLNWTASEFGERTWRTQGCEVLGQHDTETHAKPQQQQQRIARTV